MSDSASVWGRVVAQARRTPEATALRRCDGASELRYRELVADAAWLGDQLGARATTPGKRILVLSDSAPETYLAVLACASIGAIAVMVDRSMPAAAVTRFAELTDPSAVLVTPGAAALAEAARPALDALPTITVDIAASPGAAHWQAVGEARLAEQTGAEDPVAMIFTSGTTGEPKAVLLPNRTFYAVADILDRENLDWVDWVVGETTYSPLPATHIGGLWWILNCLMQGCRCVTGGEAGTTLLDTLAAHDVATTCVVPTLLTRLVEDLRTTGSAVPDSLRLVGYGGSRAVAADVEFVEAAGVKTAQVYGLSETGCTALCLPTAEGSIGRIAAGAVGRPYPGVGTHLDADGGGPGGNDAPVTAGTLWIRSPANMLGYWNNPQQSAEVLVDGWVNTGDLLELGADGYFYIRGRSSEMIISGGVNVVPDEVDRIAEDVDGVSEAACYEIPDPEFGALVGLAVKPHRELDERDARKLKQAVAAHFRRNSESMARPSSITVVDRIPRTQSGKVMRTALAAEVTGVSVRG